MSSRTANLIAKVRTPALWLALLLSAVAEVRGLGPTHTETPGRCSLPVSHETPETGGSQVDSWDLEAKAETLSRSWRGKDKRAAVALLEKLLCFYREAEDRSGEARTNLLLGDLNEELGRAREAVAFYGRSLALSGGDPRIDVQAHAGTCRALLQVDQFEEALLHARKALELSEARGDADLEAKALLVMGMALYDSRRFESSLDFLQRAATVARLAGARTILAEASLYVGYNLGDMKQEWRAIAALQEAIQTAHKAGDRRIEALALTAQGHTYSKTGEKQQAMTLYSHAAPLFEQMGDLLGSASLYSGMGYLYDELGDKENAKYYFARALALYESVGSTTGRAGDLVHLGRIRAVTNEPTAALADFREALGLLEGLPYRNMQSTVLGDIAGVLDDLGQEDEAYETYRKALQLSRDSGFARGEADILNGLGTIELRHGNAELARTRFMNALDLSRITRSRFTEARALFNLGRAARVSGGLDEALERVEEALRVVEDLRTNISSYRLRASYLSSVREIQAYEIDLLVELYHLRGDVAFAERAFVASERAKARSLLDLLLESGRPANRVDPALLQYETRLEEDIRIDAARREELGESSSGGGKASLDLDELLRELDRVRAVMRSQQARQPPVPEAEPVGVRELQRRLLDSRTALLAYFLGERESYLWVVTPSLFRIHTLPPERDIEATAHILQGLLGSRATKPGETAKQRHDRFVESDRAYWKAASLFSETVLGPALSEVDVSRIIVVSDGVLHELPFSALPLPGTDAAEDPVPLVVRYEIVRLPSATILDVIRRRSGSRTAKLKKLAVLADPVFDERDPRVTRGRVEARSGAPASEPERRSDEVNRYRGVQTDSPARKTTFPRLLSTRSEAKRILELIRPEDRLEALGFDASRGLVSAGALAHYEVVHFATHGILNVERPDLSGIVLSLFDRDGRKQDGFLRLHEIYDLDLPVRLVVLSACNTGMGTAVPSEGLVGLVGGFLAAGAEGVIASYWSVDDEATSELMTRFYSEFFNHRLPPSHALQAAQISLWRDRRWQSPFFWAAFEFHGQ
jgi:CHAT domain-containing protein/tetratricopeptide (TPR) repeat protein